MAQAIVSPYKQSLTFPAAGGSQYIQVDYDNAVTINDPYSFRLNDWFTVTQTQQGQEADGTIQRQYRVTMNPNIKARNVALEFSAVGSDGYKVKREIMLYQEAAVYSGTTSDIYLYNAPAIFPKDKCNDEVIISVGGSQSKDGKKVLIWQNLTTSQDWITDFHREGGDSDDGKTYFYYFTVGLEANTSVNERIGYCYADYICEDGEFGTATITIRQEPNNGILFDGSSTLVFQSGNMQEASPTVTYTGVTNSNTIAQPPVISSGWKIVTTYGTNLGSSYAIDYDIWPENYNVTNKDKVSTVLFQYTDKRSVHQSRTLYLNQKGTPYPFGLTYNGEEIPIEGVGINTIKRIRKIPFSGGTVSLRCYYPFAKQIKNAKLDGTYDWVGLYSTDGGYITSDTAEEIYHILFAESTQTGVRSCKFSVEYECLDGKSYYDEVQLIQDASDGSNLSPEIRVNKTEYKVKADGTPDMSSDSVFQVRYINLYPAILPLTDAEWIHFKPMTLIEGFGTNNIVYGFPVTYDANMSDSARTATVTFTDLNSEYSVSVNVIQARFDKDIIITPDIPVEGGEYIGQIWKDVEYNFGGVDEVDYSIYHNGNKIFSGRSCKKPNELSNKILVNKICQNYLTIPELKKDIVAVAGGYEDFELRDFNGNTVYKKYKFVNDWSYSSDFSTGVLSHPILNDKDVYDGQLLPFTVFAAALTLGVEYGIRYKDGYVDEWGKPVEDWEQSATYKNEVLTEIFPYSGRNYKGGVKEYYIGDKIYPVADNCKVDYVLYYINPWGGYDWFPIKGKVTETDELTQYNYVQNYNNTTWGFGKRRYLSEINKKFTLNTHWLKEDESSRMWYLMQSNTVYLHNIKDNKMYPVVITNTSQEHKKRGITSSRISYQIEVELSQGRERF